MALSNRRQIAVVLVGVILVAVYAFWGGAADPEECAAQHAVLVSGRCVDADVVRELERRNR